MNNKKKYNFLHWLFILCGAQLYLDWILITNPTSKNPIIRIIYGCMKKSYTAKNYRSRYIFSYILGVIHIIGGLYFLKIDNGLTISNLLVNVYPIIVQLWIGWRCYQIIKFKNLNKKLC